MSDVEKAIRAVAAAANRGEAPALSDVETLQAALGAESGKWWSWVALPSARYVEVTEDHVQASDGTRTHWIPVYLLDDPPAPGLYSTDGEKLAEKWMRPEMGPSMPQGGLERLRRVRVDEATGDETWRGFLTGAEYRLPGGYGDATLWAPTGGRQKSKVTALVGPEAKAAIVPKEVK